jgi:hypothetical protein
LQCKHYGAKKKVSIFKSTFHTSFASTHQTLGIKELDAIPKGFVFKKEIQMLCFDFLSFFFVNSQKVAQSGRVSQRFQCQHFYRADRNRRSSTAGGKGKQSKITEKEWHAD